MSTSNKLWYGDLDLGQFNRVWKPNLAGVYTRQQNHGGTAFAPVNKALNHLLGQHGRVNFSYTVSDLVAERASSSPAMLVKWLDNVDNARSYRVSVVALGRESGTGDASITIDGVTQGNNQIETGGSTSFPEEIYYFSFDVVRGDVTDAATLKTIVTNNNLSILSISIQDVTVDLLTSDHVRVDNYPCMPGMTATSNVSESTRSAIHELRTTNLGLAFSWSALAEGGSWINPTASDEHGIKRSSEAYANVIDQAYGSRSADTPGYLCSAYKMGIGDESTTEGKSVYIKPYVYGRVTGDYSALGGYTYGGRIKFEGPAGTSVTSSTINITYNASPQWFEGDAFCVNSSINDDVSDATANKVDVMVSATNHSGEGGFQNTILIYGFFGVYVYAP